MLSLHTNAAALSTQNSLSSTQKSLATSMTRLGTGYRVNSAMDDAAGLQIATRLDSQTRGMAVAQRNTQNGISMLQTGEGALNEVSNILLRMKDLATEAFSASSTATDKTAMQGEYDALGTELTNIVKNTSFGGTQLFSNGTTIDGTLGKMSAAMNFQIGASAGETMSVNASTQLTALTTSLAAISTQYAATPAAGTELSATANTLLTTIGTAIDKVGELRATFGAAANRLDHVYNNLQNMSTNTAAAKGRIMDTDFAAESSTMTTKQMLMQSGTAMLKQSNSMSGLVMSLLG
jgi:flagellin